MSWPVAVTLKLFSTAQKEVIGQEEEVGQKSP